MPLPGAHFESLNDEPIQLKRDSMKKQYQPLTPAALYARVSSDRQDVDLSVAANLDSLVKTPRQPGARWG